MFASNPNLRIAIYLLAVASQIASFFVTLYSPDLAVAFVSTAGVLTALAGGTAISNISASAE